MVLHERYLGAVLAALTLWGCGGAQGEETDDGAKMATSTSVVSGEVRRALFNDPRFQRGVKVLSPTAQPAVVEGSLQLTAANGPPTMALAQWWSTQSILPGQPDTLASGARRWSNHYKWVVLGPVGSTDGDVDLYCDGIAEWNGAWRTRTEHWPHLLVQESAVIAGQPFLNQTQRLDFIVDLNLKRISENREPGYSPSLHAGEFVIYFTVQNRSGGAGTSDFFWFGLKPYDTRNAKPGLYQAFDRGTGKYTYNIGVPFWSRGMSPSEWRHVQVDLLPYIKRGFAEARAAGALRDSGDLADYKIGGFNMGWEMTGHVSGEMQIKNFSLSSVSSQ